jgi:hypothetical protein
MMPFGSYWTIAGPDPRILVRQNVAVHHATAVRRLRTIAESCQELMRFPVDEPILRSAYAFGAVLEGTGDQNFVQVAFVLDVPTDELTWGTRPRSYPWLAHQLRLDRTPVDSYWRPAAWPVSNHIIRRPLRIWSTDGPDEAALGAASAGDAEELRLPAPSHGDEAEQLATELAASRQHLQRVRDAFYERDWRAEHKETGRYPEDHLWDAVHGYLDLLEAAGARR